MESMVCTKVKRQEISGIAADTQWNIFPNPVFESTFSVKFDKDIVLGEENIVVEASDLSGKVVFTQEYTQGDVVGGNLHLGEAQSRCWHVQLVCQAH